MGTLGEGVGELGGVAAGFGNSAQGRRVSQVVWRQWSGRGRGIQIWERRRGVQPLEARERSRLGRSLVGERATRALLFRLRRKRKGSV